MRILVTGGAGYIGSHLMSTLLAEGYDAYALDNLSSGHADAVHPERLIKWDLSDLEGVRKVLVDYSVDCVIHLAAAIDVQESLIDPRKYYGSVLKNSLNLLDAMIGSGVYQIIFSSTAAVYSGDSHLPLTETSTIGPRNAYGRVKLAVEFAIEDYSKAYGLHSICFRFFNAAGAHDSAELGERHDPETHLIPNALRAAINDSNILVLNGANRATPDGTCIRDFIHVQDICDAHLRALELIKTGCKEGTFNLGSGVGTSVREVLKAVEKVTGMPVKLRLGEERVGEASTLIADITKATEQLGWKPKRSLLNIIETAYRFEARRGKNLS